MSPGPRRIQFAAVVLFACTAAAACAQRFAAEPAPDPQLQIRYGGDGFHVVEMDGYGVVAEGNHFPVRAELPAVSPDLPGFYRQHGSPVAWIRGAVPQAEITAHVPSSWNGDVRVEGRSASLRFYGQGRAQNGVLQATVRAVDALPNHVEAFDTLRMEWTAIRGRRQLDLGASSNSMYVLLARPTAPLLHTAVHVATARARGLTDTTQIVDAIWSEFSDRKVHRARDGMALRYYGRHNDKAPADLRAFFVSGTGQCVAWSYFLYSALGAHGIHSAVRLISPPDLGRIYVGKWNFESGRHFIDAGPNGVAETIGTGDDRVIIQPGRSIPHSRIWTAPALTPVGLGGDDKDLYTAGENGLTDTHVDATRAIPVIPFGFGLENQRLFELEDSTDAATIELGGDDVIVKQISKRYVMSGPNGINETVRQPGMRQGPATGSRWEPVLGKGPTSIRFITAVPLSEAVPEAAGDDIAREWWLDSGADGVSQTPGANQRQGTPYIVIIEAGANGRIDSTPAGDDRIVDLSEYLDLAPPGFGYVTHRGTWALPDVGGQSNQSPPPDYPNHVIVQAGARLFDPSYGTGPFNSHLEWEVASLAGVGVRIKSNGENVKFNDRILMVARKVDGVKPLTSLGTLLPPR